MDVENVVWGGSTGGDGAHGPPGASAGRWGEVAGRGLGTLPSSSPSRGRPRGAISGRVNRMAHTHRHLLSSHPPSSRRSLSAQRCRPAVAHLGLGSATMALRPPRPPPLPPPGARRGRFRLACCCGEAAEEPRPWRWKEELSQRFLHLPGSPCSSRCHSPGPGRSVAAIPGRVRALQAVPGPEGLHLSLCSQTTAALMPAPSCLPAARSHAACTPWPWSLPAPHPSLLPGKGG